MLHTVNKSPFERDSLRSCLQFAKPGSTVLLIEDGVYGALSGSEAEESVKKAMESVTVCALQPDVEARGLMDHLLEGVKLVDYAGFVDFVEQNERVQSWL